MKRTRSFIRCCRIVLFAACVAFAGARMRSEGSGSPAREPSGDELTRLGERFYRLGIGVSGEPVAATVQGDLAMRSTNLPCVNCHRRSGLGSAEGTIAVPPVAGDVLFRPVTVGRAEMGSIRTTGAGTRPAYDDRTLTRALRDGVDPAGRSLSALMPRYDVSGADITALSTYLRLLSAPGPPGVTDSKIHLATIVGSAASAGRRDSMLDVLRTYVRAKNAGTRNETRRRERGPWDMKQHYGNYREWVLHEWNLQGPSSEWPAQLEELYRRQPVFALVSGIGDDDWSPVHEFTARHKIPVVLPHTPLPPTGSSSDEFYSLYFSKGVMLEAQALAHHLDTSAVARRVVQVSLCGTTGQAAAAALVGSLKSASTIRSDCLDSSAALSTATWRNVLRGGVDTMVLWLGSGDLRGLETLAAESSSLANVREVYLSSSLLGEEAVRVAEKLGPQAALLHPFVIPDQFERHAGRSLGWLNANGLAPSDRQIAVNALFAAALVADALSVPRTLTSREYFIERIEHMTGRSPTRSAYPGLSFDPKRRFASAGCYVLKAPPSPGAPFIKVQSWFVPDS